LFLLKWVKLFREVITFAARHRARGLRIKGPWQAAYQRYTYLCCVLLVTVVLVMLILGTDLERQLASFWFWQFRLLRSDLDHCQCSILLQSGHCLSHSDRAAELSTIGLPVHVNKPPSNQNTFTKKLSKRVCYFVNAFIILMNITYSYKSFVE